jgi:rod shape determining protein RodA
MATTTVGRTAGRGTGFGSLRRDRAASAPWRHVDVTLLVCTLALGALGVLMVFSATRGPGGPDDIVDRTYLLRQSVFGGLGLAVMAVFAFVDYRRWRRFAPIIYLGILVVLALVLSGLGEERMGAQRWFQLGPFQFQPPEVAKVGMIVVLAAYLSLRSGELVLRHLLVAIGLAVVPVALVVLQPDLGTALVFVAITVCMLLVGGAQPRHVLAVTAIGVLVVIGGLRSDMLAEYQADRLTNFADPTADVQDGTYNTYQALTTIGSGGFWGQGLFEGTQTRAGQVPEQQTDFIFTVVGEELGFVGGATVLLLYLVVLWRLWRIAQLSRDSFGTLLCVGVMAMLMFQVFQSVGMNLNIMPVTGLPLPLLSYGGSATLATLGALGLVQSVHMHRFV